MSMSSQMPLRFGGPSKMPGRETETGQHPYRHSDQPPHGHAHLDTDTDTGPAPPTVTPSDTPTRRGPGTT
jgi:hypothetical protein